MRDSAGNVFLDRDPRSFRHVLNFLRGYPVWVRPADVVLLASDVAYYGPEGMKAALGVGTPAERWRFLRGARGERGRDTLQDKHCVQRVRGGVAQCRHPRRLLPH